MPSLHILLWYFIGIIVIQFIIPWGVLHYLLKRKNISIGIVKSSFEVTIAKLTCIAIGFTFGVLILTALFFIGQLFIEHIEQYNTVFNVIFTGIFTIIYFFFYYKFLYSTCYSLSYDEEKSKSTVLQFILTSEVLTFILLNYYGYGLFVFFYKFVQF